MDPWAQALVVAFPAAQISSWTNVCCKLAFVNALICPHQQRVRDQQTCRTTTIIESMVSSSKVMMIAISAIRLASSFAVCNACTWIGSTQSQAWSVRTFFPYLDGTFEQSSYISGIIPTCKKTDLHDFLRYRAQHLKSEAFSLRSSFLCVRET